MLLPAQRGEVTVGMTLAIMLSSLASLGVTSAIIYNVNKNEDREQALKDSVAISLRFLIGMPFVIVIVYFLLGRYAHNQVFKGIADAVILSSCVQCVISLFHGFVTDALHALMDFRTRNNAFVLPYLVQVGVLFSVWITHRGMSVGHIISSVQIMYLQNWAILLAAAYSFFVLRKKHKIVYHWQLPQGWKRDYLHYGLKSCLAKLAQNLNNRLDALLINTLLNSTLTGLYAIATSLAELLLFVPSSIAAVLQPKIAGASEEEKRRLPGLMLGTACTLTFGGILLAFIFMPWFIPWYYGKHNAEAVPPALWLLPGMLGYAIAQVLMALMAGLGKPQVSAHATMSGLVATVILDFMLIPRFHIVGAAVASSIAYWVSALTVLYLYRLHTKEPLSTLLASSVREPREWLKGKIKARKVSIASSNIGQ